MIDRLRSYHEKPPLKPLRPGKRGYGGLILTFVVVSALGLGVFAWVLL